MTQQLLFPVGNYGGSAVDEVEEEIACGRASATLIEWNGNPADAIALVVARFTENGWSWDGANLMKGGWTAWFRSQGVLSSPIIQWRKV